jgi:hypothetical protein
LSTYSLYIYGALGYFPLLDEEPNIVRVIKSIRIRWVGLVARLAERRGVYRVLVGNLEGKSSLVRSRRRWEDNIKVDVQEVVWVGGHGLD